MTINKYGYDPDEICPLCQLPINGWYQNHNTLLPDGRLVCIVELITHNKQMLGVIEG